MAPRAPVLELRLWTKLLEHGPVLLDGASIGEIVATIANVQASPGGR